MALDFTLPLQTVPKYSHQLPHPVWLLSCEGRDPEFPIIGYAGEEDHLAQWSRDGKPRSNLDLEIENAPHKVVTWIVVNKRGHVHVYPDAAFVGLDLEGVTNILSVKKVETVFPVGTRDDIPEPILENIVKEFSDDAGTD